MSVSKVFIYFPMLNWTIIANWDSKDETLVRHMYSAVSCQIRPKCKGNLHDSEKFFIWVHELYAWLSSETLT